MDENVKCPECSADNPTSRATCQVCHAPLRPKTKTAKDTGTAKGAPAPEEKKEPAKKKITAKNPSPPTKTEPAPVVPVPIRTLKRRARRKTKDPSGELFFKLVDGFLVPIDVSLHVKTLLRKQAKAEAKVLISLWNRNKSLITK